MPEFSIYSAVLFVHVLSAIVLMGATLFAPLARGLVVRARSSADLRESLDVGRRAAKWNPLAAFVLLGTGVYLGSIGWWTQGWFYVAVAAWIADTALAVAVIGRSEEAMARIADHAGAGPVTAELDALRRSRMWGLAHGAMFATDLAILYVMFVKPPLSGSIGLLVFANVLILGAIAVRQRVTSLRAPAGERPTVMST